MAAAVLVTITCGAATQASDPTAAEGRLARPESATNSPIRDSSAVRTSTPAPTPMATAADRKGNVYIADGEVYVYDPAGNPIATLKTPERPTGISFGIDPATLFVTGHNSLYGLMASGPK